MADIMADIIGTISHGDSTLSGHSSPSSFESLALEPCPSLDSSASTSSESSSRSVSSTSERSPDDAATARRRGYMRPQGTCFADSARSRDSVMSLGSISHMQHYFARTGLLEGKGAQLAKRNDTSNKTHELSEFPMDDSMHHGLHWAQEADFEEREILAMREMSTYKHKEIDIDPLPNMEVLRQELRDRLATVHLTLKTAEVAGQDDKGTYVESLDAESTRGWHQVEGMNILDVVTLAIQAAKNYYTAHSHPERLHLISTEREIRSDLYEVMDVLKRLASRAFNGGLQQVESHGILKWTSSVVDLLTQEEQQDRQAQALRNQWSWRTGDWTRREREREWAFLKSFLPDGDQLPPWGNDGQEFPFLAALQSGLTLVLLHNALVTHSGRHFGEIKSYHTDLAKPYRCAENLAFWVKAAELRWEVKLTLNVLDVVYGKDRATWEQFDRALLTWCKRVREELTKGWEEAETGAVLAVD